MADEAKSLRKNERARMLMILGGVVAIIAVVVAVSALRTKAPVRQSGTTAQTQLPNTPDVHAIPGTSDSPQHNQLMNQANQEGSKQAADQGTSFVPTITANNGAGQKDPFDLAQQKGAAPTTGASAPVATPPAVVAPVAAAQVAQPVQQQQVDPEQRQRVNQREQVMALAMQKLLEGWVPGSQHLETDYTGSARGQTQTAQAGVATASTTQSGGNAAAVSANGSNSAAAAQETPLIRAASIIPAVLMTSINSDEPGPVLAQIVTGPFEGARALGTFTKPERGEKAVMQFTMLSLPGAEGKTLNINAFAVDPESARTALATDVDHHYLSRYGVLFASAFLSGYGNALQTSGGTVTQGLYGTQTTYPQINTAQKAFVALGQVGQVAGTQLQSEFNRPITIKVEQGTPMGLLFMQDVVQKR